MLILIALITLLIVIRFFKLAKDHPYDMWDVGVILFGAVFIVCAIAILWNGYCVHRCAYVIPAQIAMYEEENARIEEKVRDTVNKYMEYEGGVIMEIAPEDDVMTLISLYPDLNIRHDIAVSSKNTGSEKCNRSKITDADVKIMLELKAEGLSNKKISEQIGCSEQTVANYLAKQNRLGS